MRKKYILLRVLVNCIAFTHQWIWYEHSNDMFPWKLNFGFHQFPATNCRFAAKFVDFLLIIFILTLASNEDEKLPMIYHCSEFHIIKHIHPYDYQRCNKCLLPSTYLFGSSHILIRAFKWYIACLCTKTMYH